MTPLFLSACINLFDGHELLVPLVKHIRPEVDHLSIVYQSFSFCGNPAADDLVPLIDTLKGQAWIDDVMQYDPSSFPASTPKEHEARKRTVGFDAARAAGATHHLSLDVDEFYRAGEFRRAIRLICDEGFDATACRIQDYHARPIYRCRELARYHGIDLYVPFICRVDSNVHFDSALDFFCPVDPARRVRYKRPYVFPPDQLLMHHMTTVRGSRQSLVSKFVNSSSRSIFSVEDPAKLAELVWHFDPQRDAKPNVSVVVDEFGIGDVFETFAAPRNDSVCDVQTFQEAI
jgi:hypothetical protein